LISMAVESPRRMKKLKDELNTPIPLIVDRGGAISKAYEVYLDKAHPDYKKFQSTHAIPSKFLINQEGTIVWKIINPAQERPSIALLKEALQKNL